MTGQIIGYVILGAVLLLLAIMIIRALALRKPERSCSEYTPADIDRDALSNKLQGAVRIKTVTLPDNDADGSIFF